MLIASPQQINFGVKKVRFSSNASNLDRTLLSPQQPSSSPTSMSNIFDDSSLYPKMLPRSIRCLLLDLIKNDDDNGDVGIAASIPFMNGKGTSIMQYKSLQELEDDLRQMINEPHIYLFDSKNIIDSTDDIFKKQKPNVLHGRSKELEKLVTCCQNICCSHPSSINSGNGENIDESEREIDVKEEKKSQQQDDEDHGNIAFLSGPSGSGKSTLVRVARELFLSQQKGCAKNKNNNLNKRGESSWGNFIVGKFDQLKVAGPYSALIVAFNQLCHSFLSMENSNLKSKIRESIKKAVGTNGRVLTDVIPKLQEFIGDQPPLEELDGAIENQNRFNHTFQNFVKSVCSNENPLVLVLDDIQWADVPSLDLIIKLVSEKGKSNEPRGHFLFVGCYRDEDVISDHILAEKIRELETKKIQMTNIKLGNLDECFVNDFISERLRLTKRHTKSLSTITHRKTLGNPFFVNQFLLSLCEHNILKFSDESMRWEWIDSEVDEECMIDDVVKLMAGKIQSLDSDVQNLLKISSCIGSFFERNVLLMTTGTNTNNSTHSKKEQPIDEMLHALVKKGLIIKMKTYTDQYRFSHDRIQQVAYSLLSESQKGLLHLKIGQILLQQHHVTFDVDVTPDDCVGKNSNMFKELPPSVLFAATDQLNRGFPFMQNMKEVLLLAELNFKSGENAMQSSAFATTETYLLTALRLLDSATLEHEHGVADESKEEQKTYWSEYYDFALKLHYLLAESKYCQGKSRETQIVAETVFDNAKSFAEKVPIYIIMIKALGVKGRYSEAVALGLNVLREMGKPLPRASVSVVIMELMKTKMSLRKKSDEYLASLPQMTDENKLMEVEILKEIGAFAYCENSPYFPLAVFRWIQTTLQYGMSKYFFYFAGYGMILNRVLGDVMGAYRYGKLSLMILERSHSKNQAARVYVPLYGYISHFRDHIQLSLRPLSEAYHLGLDAGDHEYAMYGASNYGRLGIFSGQPLEPIVGEINIFCRTAASVGQETIHYVLTAILQTSLNLTGSSPSPTELSGAYMSEDELFDKFASTGVLWGCYLVDFYSTFLLYLFGFCDVAAKRSKKAFKTASVTQGSIEPVLQVFYDGLISFAMARGNSGRFYSRTKWMRRGRKALNTIKQAAKNAPGNYLQKYLLLRAEEAALNRRKVCFAEKTYCMAIETAKENGFMQDEALAYELCGAFYDENGQNQLASSSRTKSYELYTAWGAHAKAQQVGEYYLDKSK